MWETKHPVLGGRPYYVARQKLTILEVEYDPDGPVGGKWTASVQVAGRGRLVNGAPAKTKESAQEKAVALACMLKVWV